VKSSQGMPCAAGFERPASEPIQHSANANGIVTIAGIDSGQIASSLPMTSGPRTTRTRLSASPPTMPHVAPVRLKPFQ
jgi:hypothetical protein